MLIGGILLLIAGAISCVVGITQNNNLEAQVTSLMNSGNANPGTIFIVIGAIAAAVGLILLILGLKNKNDN